MENIIQVDELKEKMDELSSIIEEYLNNQTMEIESIIEGKLEDKLEENRELVFNYLTKIDKKLKNICIINLTIKSVRDNAH